MEGFFIFRPIALLVALLVTLIVVGHNIRNARKRREAVKPSVPTPDTLAGWDATKIDVPQVPLDEKPKTD